MKRERMIQLIGDRLIGEIKQLAVDKNVDIQDLIVNFANVIDINIISPELSADEVAQQHDHDLDIDNLKAEVMAYVKEQLNEEYTVPMFLN